MKTIRPFSILQAGLLLAVLTCFALGCRDLAPTGVYAGDQTLYQSELAIQTAHDLVHTYVKWERDNRAWLVKWPEIKRSADTLRVEFPKAYATANALHDAYATAPTDTNRAALEKSLNVLRAALAEAAKYMALAAQPKP